MKIVSYFISGAISSVQFSCSVMSDSLQPCESQHTRPPCPSPIPGVYSNPCPSSRWCHPAISSSVIPFSSWSQFSQHQGLFQWVNSSHEVARVLEFQLQHHSNEHPRLISFRMDLLDLLAVPRTLKSLLQHHSSKASIFRPQFRAMIILISWVSSPVFPPQVLWGQPANICEGTRGAVIWHPSILPKSPGFGLVSPNVRLPRWC